MRTAVLGDIVLPGGIERDGAVIINGGVIEYAGAACDVSSCQKVLDFRGFIVGPGFVDIHCHAGGDWFAYEDPVKMARFHLEHGTTGLLCTLYRNQSPAQILDALGLIKKAMGSAENILGVHLEGPYISAKYGSMKTEQEQVDRSVYSKYIESGIIRQWTFSPELEGTDSFLEDILAAGIAPAIGHSEASPQRVFEVAAKGVKIVTHLTNATGTSINPSRYGGTKEVSFDAAALLCDNLFYEVICDRNGIHVRPEMLRLIVKCAGVDRVVGITDCFKGPQDDNDVNLIDGKLTGSKLTMDKVASNLHRLGFGPVDIFKMLSYNPARAIGVDGLMGSLTKGKRADIVIADCDYNLKLVMLGGKYEV